MAIFGGKKAVKEAVLNVSVEDFLTLKARVTALELEIETFRNKVLRKIQVREQEQNPGIKVYYPGQKYEM